MKRIVIIGASSGIGLESALIFARKGWKVGVAARHVGNLRALKNQYPNNIEYSAIDVTGEDAPEKLLGLVDSLGGMDVLFHAAGIGWSNPELDIERDLATVKTNAEGFVRIVDTAYRYFADNGKGGQIAAITSVAGTMGIGISAAYSATKRFQNTYLESLEQLAAIDGLNIRFTDIRPGFVRTALLASERKYPMLMEVDYAAKRIVDAIIDRKHIAYIDCRWGVLVFLWRLIPRFLWRRLKISL